MLLETTDSVHQYIKEILNNWFEFFNNRDRHYGIKVLIYWVDRVGYSRESHQEVRESVRNVFLTALIVRRNRIDRPTSCWRYAKSWVPHSGPTSSLILRDTRRFQGRQVHDWSSLVEFADNTQRRIYLYSSQFLQVKSVACLQWRICLLASLKETIVARYSASQVLVVVFLFHRFVSLNYSFIINKLFVVASTIDCRHHPSLNSSEWV